MSRIIIENKSSISDSAAVELVAKVIKLGRISNNDKQYCYLSLYREDAKLVQVATELNKKSDKFIVCDDIINIKLKTPDKSNLKK